MIRECWIYTLSRPVGQAGVNLEWICSCGSELVLSYSLSCISNSCKLYKGLQIVILMLVVVSFSPTALILHKGADRSLWVHDKSLEELEIKPQMFYMAFFKSELFSSVCVEAAHRGQRLLGSRDCQPGKVLVLHRNMSSVRNIGDKGWFGTPGVDVSAI